jgi:hypothetical protein
LIDLAWLIFSVVGLALSGLNSSKESQNILVLFTVSTCCIFIYLFFQNGNLHFILLGPLLGFAGYVLGLRSLFLRRNFENNFLKCATCLLLVFLFFEWYFQNARGHGLVFYLKGFYAQIIGLGIICTSQFVLLGHQKNISEFRVVLGSSIVILGIGYGYAISAIGLILSLTFWIFLLSFKWMPKKNVLLTFCATASTVFLIYLLWPVNWRHRIELWQQAIQIVSRSWLGTGPGTFTFESFPFKLGAQFAYPKLFEIETSPHNELLRMAVDYGVPIAVILTAIYLLILKRIIRDFNGSGLPWVLGVACLLTVESMFQPAYENPICFFFLSLVFGYGLKDFEANASPAFEKLIQILISLHIKKLFIILGVLGIIVQGSVLAMGNGIYLSRRLENIVCQSTGSTWIPCLTYIQRKLEEGDLDTGKRLSLVALKAQKYNVFSAMKLSEIYFMQGDNSRACALWTGFHMFVSTGDEYGLMTSLLCANESKEDVLMNPHLNYLNVVEKELTQGEFL